MAPLGKIPCKVKCCLKNLTPGQQVILRGYIATLREEHKEKETELQVLKDKAATAAAAAATDKNKKNGDPKTPSTEQEAPRSSSCCSEEACPSNAAKRPREQEPCDKNSKSSSNCKSESSSDVEMAKSKSKSESTCGSESVPTPMNVSA